MFRLNLVLRRKNDDVMIFSPAPWFRILFLFLTAIVVTGIITIASDGESGRFILPVIISALCIIAALYEESWEFDRNRRIITFKSGLIFIHKSKIYSFAEIENLELSAFLRGAESDSTTNHQINLTKPFSKENTGEASGRGLKIIHPKYHQEIRLYLKSGNRVVIESLDSRGTEALSKKAAAISSFSGIKLEK